MAEIGVFFVNQPDGGTEPLNTFTCNDDALSSTLDGCFIPNYPVE